MQPTNNSGSIIIRFTKFGYKYSLSGLGKFNDKVAMATAKSICAVIETDIKLGRFTSKDNASLFTDYHPLALLGNHHEGTHLAIDCLTMVLDKISTRETKNLSLSQVQNYLEKYGKAIKNSDDAQNFWQWLVSDTQRSPNTSNRYLRELKANCHYFMNIQPLSSKQAKTEKPFTKNEIKQIIEIFDKDYSHYSAFVKFLFSTGVRTSEAIALTWDNVDFENRTITIAESIGIANDGSKVRKGTKTGVVRVIPMSDAMYKVLSNHKFTLEFKNKLPHTIPDWLTFPSYLGTFIDTGNFRARIWVKALLLAKVPYRTPYNTRHTFCSHFLNETPDFIKLASITHGTKSGVQTLIKHYAHIVEKVTMPDMF